MTAKLYRHACGMEVFSLECDDVENVFAIAFNTSPVDNTGVPHIIEHSVLCGSKRYPVKEPFTEMLKGSLATFINAFTTHDYTAYPIASVVPKDYFNLASVYFDAVFNPLMTREAFMQEGWHLELSNSSIKSPLKYNGIVLNEMKGDENDIDVVICREINNALFSRTRRRFNAGGEPDAIPKLTYRKYRNFYRTHYHPSLAKVYLYGNIPTEQKLAFLERELETITPFPKPPRPLPPAPVRTPWRRPHLKSVRYVPELSQDMKKGAWAKAYYLENTYEPLLDSAFSFLEALLQSNPSRPLNRRLMESGLCDSFCISGYDDETLETSYLVALNGVRLENFGKVEKLVDDIFRDAAAHGFSSQEIESVMTRFKHQQAASNDSSVMPIMEEVFDGWCFGLSPFIYFDKSDNLKAIEMKIAAEPGWLQHLIKKYFCDNSQTITLRLTPDSKLQKEQNEAEKAILNTIRQKMTRAQLEQVDATARKLKRLQATPNSPKVLATLPTLNLHDIPKASPCVKTVNTRLQNGITLLDVSMPVNGISYMSFAIPLGDFPEELLDAYEIFWRCFHTLGTARMPWDKAVDRWASLGASCSFSMRITHSALAPHELRHFLIVSLNALDERFPEALDFFAEKWNTLIFSERQRVDILIRRLWSSIRSNLSGNSYLVAERRARAGLTPIESYGECHKGIPAYKMFRRLREGFRSEYPQLEEKLSAFQKELSSRSPIAISFLASEANKKRIRIFAESLAAPTGTLPFQAFTHLGIPDFGRREALAVPAPVSGCARAFRSPHTWEKGFAELLIYANLLSNGYLWEEIRLKNGAYGVNCQQMSANGIFTITTTQDPSPKDTFHILNCMPNLPLDFSEKELTQTIISSVKDFIPPTRQVRAAYSALLNHVCDLNDDIIGQTIEQCLAVTPAGLKNAVTSFFESAPPCNDCVVGPEKAISPLEMTRLEI